MDPKDMTVAQLNDAIRAKGNEIDAEKEKLRALCRIRDEKAEMAEIARIAPNLAKKLGLPAAPPEDKNAPPAQKIG